MDSLNGPDQQLLYSPDSNIFMEIKKKVNEWEEKWINTPYTEQVEPFEHPVAEAKKLAGQFTMPQAE